MNQPITRDANSSDPQQETAAEDPQSDTAQLDTAQSDVTGLRKYDNPFVIVLLLFCVTGALGLPLIWYSKSFSRPVRIVLSIVVSIYTIFLLVVFGAVMTWVISRIGSAIGTFV